jgi:hypothetical protein
MDDAQERAPLPAVRLIFEIDGDAVRLISQQPVDIAVPGFDLAQVPHPGHYVETRNSDNEALSRVPVREGFATSAEVFPEEPGEPITRIDLPKPQGAFTVVVPAGEAAKQIVLVQVLPRADVAPAGRTEAGVVELARFPLAARDQESDRIDEHH